MLYDIRLSNMYRGHVIEYIRNKKEHDPNYKVIDIGASANYTNWSYDVIDFVVDLNKMEDSEIKQFNFNINYESQWEELEKFVEENGKFDFCICSHTLEDIAMPSVVLEKMQKISKEGFIAVPSKFIEFSKIDNQPWLGYIHHRWIFTLKNNTLLALPKLNFIEYAPDIRAIGNNNLELIDLSFFWKDNIEYQLLNDDYMGPSVQYVLSYYGVLLEDDFQLI